jgi:hypothetical protein
MAITYGAKNHGAKRTHEKTDAEDCECGEDAVPFGKEVPTNQDREVAIKRKVVPLKDVTDYASD